MNPQPEDSLLSALATSKAYRDYEPAFTQSTGLPLQIHAPHTGQLLRFSRKQENPFFTLLADTPPGCSHYLSLQQQLEREAEIEPRTLRCFAGLCATAVPIRVGDQLIAFLQTGQVLLRRPSTASFKRITNTLASWGAVLDLKKVEAAYFNLRVFSPAQYDATIRLLVNFAEHLAARANALSLHREKAEPAAITKAKEFIEANAHEHLGLAQVAHVAGMSATYFSEKFKEVTGVNFVEFIARTRVERARHLLGNLQKRITEVAFEVGFQSLSQFNRSFRQYCGLSPRAYRAKLGGPTAS